MSHNLDRLNHLLKDTKLNLPDFRRVVNDSGSNLPWLRKALRKKPISEELQELLDMSQIELMTGLQQKKKT
jgi:predicted membrane chloride channel (bestrophin family)